jgi:hypothetical protein
VSAPDRGRRRLLLAAGAVVGLAAVGGAGVLWLDRGPDVVGPSRGAVGDQVAFAVPGTRVVAWRAGGVTSADQVFRFVPQTPGPVEVEVETEAGTASHSFVAHEPEDDTLRIAGDAHLPVDSSRELTATGADGGALTWELGGSTYHKPTVVVTPDSPGLVTVTVTAADGSSVTRVFTASEETSSR